MDSNYTRFLEETLREQIKTTSLVLERLHEAQAELETRTRERDLWKEKVDAYRSYTKESQTSPVEIRTMCSD